MANNWGEDYDDEPSSNWNWTEAQWNRFLGITDNQVRKFLALYNSHLDNPNRLDAVADKMGWVAESWPLTETDGTPKDPPAEAEEVPYTLHLHPVYTVTRALFQSLRELSFSFARLNNQHPLLQIAFSSSLHEAETQAILGIESQDMGDMTLTVCHFKRSLSHINHSLAILERMVAHQMEGAELFSREAQKRIFDLREVWLRVNSDIREEIKRHGNDEE
jgi:hypothetical protein